MDCSMPDFPVLHYILEWCHPTISSSASPSPPALGLFQHQGLSQWVGSLLQVAKELELQHQSFQFIFRADFLQDWLVWSTCCSRDSKQSSLVLQFEFESISSSVLSLFYGPTLISLHDYWKNHSLTTQTFVGQVMSLLLNMLSRFVIAILPRSKCPLISWLQSPSTVILEPKKIKSILSFLFLKTKLCKIFCFLELWKLEK